jgi:iron complex transport system substrate-binding protein
MNELRIASLAPSNTEILYAIGAGEQVICITDYCDYPPDIDKPHVGGWTTPNIEKLRELKPDVVVTSTFLQDNITTLLRKQGLRVLQLKPSTLHQVFESILQLGVLTNKKGGAVKVVEEMKRELNELKAKTGGKLSRVYVEEWSNPPMVSGNWVPELIGYAGGVSLAKPGERSRKITKQELIEFNPEFVFLSICGEGEKPSAKKFLEKPELAGIEAVKNKQVHVINDSLLNRPGPRLVQGARKISELMMRTK